MTDTTAKTAFEATRDEFLLRYYVWSKQQSQQELESGFPVLRRVKNGTVERFLRFLEPLDRDDKMLLRSALLKMFHPKWSQLSGDPINLARHPLEAVSKYADYWR
jgi:hypothetical protein